MKPERQRKLIKALQKEDDSKMFLLVWSDNRSGYNTTPTKKHFSLEEAEKEAKRLSQVHVGIKFYIARIGKYFISEAKIKSKTLK
jgi:hypothetical protein